MSDKALPACLGVIMMHTRIVYCNRICSSKYIVLAYLPQAFNFRRSLPTLHARERFYRWMSTAITLTMVVHGLDH